MRIEASLIDQNGQKLCKLPNKIDNKSKKVRRRQKKSMPSVVQKLFETCKEVFANSGTGTVPSHADEERLRLVLDSMKPAHVGLTPDMPYFRTIETEEAPPITYLHLYECNRFSIGIFCLPPSGVIPLHNHPGMTVFSKLLFGSMHIKSYDWTVDVPRNANENLNPSQIEAPGVRLANIKINSVFTAPCDTTILYPAAGGNMHCFKALTSCAVLDVLGPPYSDPEGRHCTYYRDSPYTSFLGEKGSVQEGEREGGYAWLEEMEKPEDFIVDVPKYRGPKIVEK